MGAPWSRVVNSTIKKYIREREINILRNRKLTALLKKKGRISFNWSGTAMDWKVKYKRVRMTPFADGDTLEFSRKDRNKTAQTRLAGLRGHGQHDQGRVLAEPQHRGDHQALLRDQQRPDRRHGGRLRRGGLRQRVRCRATPSGSTASSRSCRPPPTPGTGPRTPTGSFAGLSCVPGAFGGQWDSGNASRLAERSRRRSVRLLVAVDRRLRRHPVRPDDPHVGEQLRRGDLVRDHQDQEVEVGQGPARHDHDRRRDVPPVRQADADRRSASSSSGRPTSRR